MDSSQPSFLEKKHAITMVRLSFQSSSHTERLQVDAKPLAFEWRSTINLVRKQEGWRYVNLGQEPGNPNQVVLIIGWLDYTTPTPLFRPGRTVDDPILPHLEPFLTEPPEVLTLWHGEDRASRKLVLTDFNPRQRAPSSPLHIGGIADFMTLEGPKDALEAGIKEIAFMVDIFNEERTKDDPSAPRSFLFLSPTFFLLEDTNAVNKPEEGFATFACITRWTGRRYRDECKHPNTSSQTSEDALGREFWEKNVQRPLDKLVQEQNVSLTSWDYEAHSPVAYNDVEASFQHGYRF